MQNKDLIYILILTAGLFISGCNKNIAPGGNSNIQEKTYDEATFDYIYSEGLRQKLLGNMADALTNFEQCIKLNPGSDASNYQIAQILLGSGDIANGKKFLKKAVELGPENIWYSLSLANLFLQQNNLDSAIICYEKIVRVYPDKENLEVSLANLYAEDKKFNEARVILSRFDEKYGTNENTTLALVKILMEEKKYREAHEKIRELIAQKPDDVIYNGIEAEIYRNEGETKKASDLYSELIKRNPDNPQIQLSLCDFLISEKDYDEMFNILSTITINSKIAREQKITLFSNLIDNKNIQNQYGKKLEIALMVLEANYSGDNIIILMRPDFLEKVKKLKDASVRLEEIIQLQPDNYFAWEKLLLVYFEMKDYKMLEQRGMECATKFNMSILAKILYANAAMENKEYTTALEELRKAEILAGENKDQKLQVLTMKADVYYRMKDFTDSFVTFDQAMAVNDTDMTVLNNYAYYLAEQNMRLKDAEKMAKEVVTKAKNNSTFLDTYAWVLFKRGKNKDAARIMEKILNEGKPDDAEYYEHYGFILKKLGKCREAIEEWENALKIDKTKTYLEKEIDNCRK
jgi:predicted Zn-dependent protease